MISHAIWYNTHLLIFQRLQIALVLWAHAVLLSLKNLLVLINTKFLLNHVITYTKCMLD